MVLGLQNEYPTSTSSTANMFDTSETVTLTKAQLTAILEAVGQVGGLRTSEESTKPPIHVGNNSSDQDFYSVQGKLPATQVKINRSVDENVNGFPFAQASDSVSRLSVSSSQNASVSSGHTSPVSRLQQKRLQWERERAETDYWNPWGRPGGGAPRKSKRSVVMATVSPSTSRGSLNKPTRGYSSCSYMTSASLPLSTSYGQRVPDFIKSSLPFGPNCDDIEDNDQLEKKRQWIAELDSQREEQRRLRQSNETYDDDHWVFDDSSKQLESRAGQESGMNTPLSMVTSMSRSYHRGQTSVALDPDRASQLQEQRSRAEEYRRLIEEQVQEKRRQQEEERERQRREEEQEELRLEQERERLRIQYESEQKQIKEKEEKEEQKQQMMAAAVLKAREEAEAERKAKKAQRLNSQPAKSPKATPTHQPHPPSKISNRDDPLTNSKLDDCRIANGNVSSNTSPKHTDSKMNEQPQQTASIRPIQSCPLSQTKEEDGGDSKAEKGDPANLKSVREFSSQTDQHQKLPPEPSAYVVNRLLTPSVWRSQERKIAAQNAWGHQRDMFTQTESLFFWDDQAEAKGPSSEQGLYYGDSRSSRNSSATSGKRSCMGSKSEAGSKPVWGANQPVKSFVKMTDRDPNHYRHKRFQEMRRQHWEREMATLREQMAQARARSRATATPSMGTNNVAKSAATKTPGVSLRQSRGRAAVDSAFQVRRRAVSDHQSDKHSERDSAWSSAGSSVYTMSANSLGTTYTVSSLDGHLPTLSRRWSQSSDQIPPSTKTADGSQIFHSDSFDDPYLVDGEQNASLFPPVRRKWHSQESFSEASQQQAQVAQEPRSHSPASLLEDGAFKSSDEPSILAPPPAPRRKWSEQGNFDPAAVALGKTQGINQDSEKDSPVLEKATAESESSPDPLVNPKVVTSRPTPRQDRILQQLSTLRQGLLQKQREIETLVRHPASWPS